MQLVPKHARAPFHVTTLACTTSFSPSRPATLTHRVIHFNGLISGRSVNGLRSDMIPHHTHGRLLSSWVHDQHSIMIQGSEPVLHTSSQIQEVHNT